MAIIDRVRPSTPEDPGDDDLGRMSLVDHLRELRSRLVKSVLAIALGAAVAFAFYNVIIGFLIQPYCDILPKGRECAFLIRDPLEGFSARMRVSGYGGLFLASPVVLWQLWRFITPGLHKREKRYAIPFVVSSVVLFAAGATVALLTLPRTIEFLNAVAGVNTEPFYSPSGYLKLVTLMLVAFGLAFEFPILLVFLELAGLVTSKKLRSWRRYAAVVIVAAAAVITPSQDPISLFAMAGPMYVFYEAAIIIGRVMKR